MKNNTVVTIGGMNYLWGIFMLIASMRKNGMDEPVIVGTADFTAGAENILLSLGNVRCVPIVNTGRSLACCKAEIMLRAETEYITWADSDGFFTGNVSKLLVPDSPDEIHIRRRSPEENPLAFRRRLRPGEDGRTIPEHILKVWQENVGERTAPAIMQSCSSCFLSVHRKARPFLERWDSEMKKVLPAHDVGVVDYSLEYYHQLDESVLNSLLCFSRNAPETSETFTLDKNPEAMYIHFGGNPKPWQGWNSAAVKYFDEYTALAEFAARHWPLPSAVPYSLKRENKLRCRILARPLEFAGKLSRFVRRHLALILLLSAFKVYALPQGEWRAERLDSSHIVLAGDYTKAVRREFAMRDNIFLSGWKKEAFQNRLAGEIIERTHRNLANLFKSAGFAGYWLNAVGQARFPEKDGKMIFLKNAEIVHYLFIRLEKAAQGGEKRTILLPTGENVSFTMPEISRLFKFNQTGYSPAAGRKFAYMGAWLGTGGAMPMAKCENRPFFLVDSESNKRVFTGKAVRRMNDVFYKNSVPFTGEEVLELDFSSFNTPGRYFLQMEGAGRSEDFLIHDSAMAEAFYIHARGLFHKRCGTELKPPFTFWSRPMCHSGALRGTFPPHDRHYNKGDRKRDYGFFNAAGESISVNHFRLIEQNRPAVPETVKLSGGWHDAADYDRRPMHMGIAGDLAAVYLMKPENFSDGQLNIPESGNGIPDILDEAVWGLEHLRQSQQSNGGVGTWIETTRHPGAKDGMPHEDGLIYFISAATRQSSLEYAGYASTLALALKKAGAEKLSSLYTASAKKAWNFAQRKENRLIRTYQYSGETVFYREAPELPAGDLFKAGVNLYLLTGKKSYLDTVEAESAAVEAALKKEAWRWSPLFWITGEDKLPFRIKELVEKHRDIVTAEADRMLIQQEEGYPCRMPWFKPDSGWVHTMGWGNYHPLRRALTLIAANYFTGMKRYLAGAYLANDFHNGANPSGVSMTCGLGKICPVRFLDLISYSDRIGEFVPGITPYRNTFGIDNNDFDMVHRYLFKSKAELEKAWPILRRNVNLEAYSVPSSEYSVWETIAPAAVTTGYLLNGAALPEKEWLNRRPAEDITELPGFAPLP